MTTAFPTGLDNFINPTPTDRLATPTVLHTDQHSNANDAIEALERKVGADGSSDPTSLDYKVAHITSGSAAPFQTDFPADVGPAAVTGTSGSVPHADHVHQGVHSITVDPLTPSVGDITLISGTNILISQSSGSFTIDNTMAAGGIVFDENSPQDVSDGSFVGTSGSPPHGDHIHRGVRSVFTAPNSGQFGDIELFGSGGLTIAQSSGSFTFSQDLSGYTPTSRTISTAAPLAGGGDLSANRTLSIAQAGAASDGYLSSADWGAFNAKPSGLTPFDTGTPSDVSAASTAGTSGSVPHADHAHRGVHGLFTAPNATQYGDIALQGAGNITVSQSSGSFTIATSGSFLPQTHDINGAHHEGFPLRPDTGGTGTIVTPTAGAVLIGKLDGSYAPNHLIAGSNISITNTSGSVTITNTMAVGGITFDGNTPQDVGAASGVGTSGSPPHGDHIHKGVRSIYTAPNAGMSGNVELVGQGAVAITQSSGSLTLNVDLSGYVQNTRTISTTAPLAGGGDLSANRTLSIAQASHTVDGYLSAADWTTFNNKRGDLTPFQTDSPAEVGASASTGTSGSVPHADHVHRGVHGLFVTPNASQYGDIALVASGNITVSQSSGSFTVGTSGSFLPQVHDINGAYHNGTPLRPENGGTGVNNGTNRLTVPATGTAVLTARAINTTAPLAGGGDLSADRTLSIPQSSHTVDGYLSAADWTTFNNKQGNLTPFQTDAPADIAAAASTGTSGSVPHADHVHKGVHSMFVAPNAGAFGDVALAGSGDIAVTQSSGSFTVAASSGSFLPRTHDINGQYHTGFPLRTDKGGTGTGTAPTAGALPIGKSDGTYAPNHLIAGTNIGITNTSGSVTINNTMTTIDSSNVLIPVIGAPTYNTEEELQTLTNSAGVLDATVTYVTQQDSTHINVAAGKGMLRISNSPLAQLVSCEWAASNNIAIPAGTGGVDTTRFVGVEYNAGSPQVTVRTTFNWNWYTDFPLARVSQDGTTLRIINTYAHSEDTANLARRFNRLNLPFIREEPPEGSGGLVLSSATSGGNSQYIAMTAGNVWHGFNRYILSAVDTTGAGRFDSHYRNGSGGFTNVTNQQQWDNTHYDDGTGTLATLTNNKYAVHWVYVDVSDGSLDLMFGTGQYNTSVLAQAEGAPSSIPGHLQYHGRLIGRIIFQKSAITPDLVQSAFSTQFNVSGITTHNELAGLQGGTAGEYYHLTNAELTSLTSGMSSGSFLPQTHDINGQYHSGAPLRVDKGGLGTVTAPTAGAIPIGTLGGVYAPNHLVAGTNISITNTSGSVTITNTMSPGAVVFDASSPLDVGASASVGTSGSPPHGDHVHRGVHGLFVAPSAVQYGNVALVGSSNIAVTQSSGSFTFASSGSFVPQVHDINGVYHNGTPLRPENGGTGVNNGSNLLTIPATGTAALVGIDNTFVAQTVKDSLTLKGIADNPNIKFIDIGDSTPRYQMGVSGTGSYQFKALDGSRAFAIVESGGNTKFSIAFDTGATTAQSTITATSSVKGRGSDTVPALIGEDGNYGTNGSPYSSILLSTTAYLIPSILGASIIGLNAYSSSLRNWLQFTTVDGAGTRFTPLTLYHDGTTGVGTTAPAAQLHISLENATTNAVDTALIVAHNTTGTAANGFGTRQLFTLESSTTVDSNAAAIDVVWTDATHATRTSDLVFSTVLNGSLQETLRLDGSSKYDLTIGGDRVFTVPATGTAVLGTGTTTRVAAWSGTNTIGSSNLIFSSLSAVTLSMATNFGLNNLVAGVSSINIGTGVGGTVAMVYKTDGDVSAYVVIAGGKTLTVSDDATISGTNTGDQTITLSGAVTGSGTGAITTTFATPGTLTVSTTNSNANAHTHAITSSANPGAAASILATDSSGNLVISGEFRITNVGPTMSWLDTTDSSLVDVILDGGLFQFRRASGTPADILHLDVANELVLVMGTTDSSSATTGALQSAGGAGIAKKLFVGTSVNIAGTSNQLVLQSAGVTGTLTWTPASSNKVITLPNLTGTAALGAGTATVSSSNSVTVADHTHAVTSSSNPGAAASLLATDSSGNVQIVNLTHSGTLISAKNSTTYTGYIYVPLSSPLTSTSYDGNDTVTASTTTTVDTSASFGAPVGIKAAYCRMSAVWTGAGTTRNLQLRAVGGSLPAVIMRSQVANIFNDASGIVPCDSNGDFDVVCASGENAGSVTIVIFGYWI